MDRNSGIDALTDGAVRGWHIALLFTMIWCSMVVASAKIVAGWDPLMREELRVVLMQGLTAALVIAVTLAVPELRRALPSLYERSRPGLDAGDALLVAALMFTWALGAHRLFVFYPLLNWERGWFDILGFRDRVASFDPIRFFPGLFVASIVAPFAEELVFRGYLLNLWTRRWGRVAGIALSSAFFGLFHFQFAIMAGIAGVFFALIYLRFRSLWPGTLLHSLHNTVAGPLGLALFVHKPPEHMTSLSAWVPEMILTAAFFPLLALFWTRFRPSR